MVLSMSAPISLLSVGAIVGMVFGGFFLLLILFIVCWGIRKANYFRRMQVKIKESASDIDVALTKRYDLLTKEYDIVKGYTKHESSTLINVTNVRAHTSSAPADPNIKDMSKFNADLDMASKEIHVAVEQYPDLKANTVFLSLQNACTDTEEHLAASRRLYTSNVSLYNSEIVTFPSSVIAGMIHAQPADFFQAEEAKKSDVKMEF
ncbi:MAG: LemA family protein [Bacilli bacterium]|jgi:LemA protein|nr:LemA family protein [Bacilli bacterium]